MEKHANSEEETSHDFKRRYPERVIATKMGPPVSISMEQGDQRFTVVDILKIM